MIYLTKRLLTEHSRVVSAQYFIKINIWSCLEIRFGQLHFLIENLNEEKMRKFYRKCLLETIKRSCCQNKFGVKIVIENIAEIFAINEN